MFKHWMEIVHNHDNGYRDWLFDQNVLLRVLRESQLPLSFNGRGFTLKGLFRSQFTEL